MTGKGSRRGAWSTGEREARVVGEKSEKSGRDFGWFAMTDSNEDDDKATVI